MAARQRWRGRWEGIRERQMGGQELVEHEQPQLEEDPWEQTHKHTHGYLCVTILDFTITPERLTPAFKGL